MYNLTVKKLNSTKAKCSFGYINDLLDIYVELKSSESKEVTSYNEEFFTVLPSEINGENSTTLRVYVKCMDSDGMSGIAIKTVNITKAGFTK